MAIGEVFLGAFITVMFERLASREFIRLAQSAKILSELENLRRNLELIQAVLIDAGQKQITQKAVELWLNKLQHLAYEIDDVLDDLATEATRRKLKNKESEASTSKKVLKFIPTKFNAVKYGLKMRIKIDEITTKLVDLVNQKQLLGLNDNVERPKSTTRRQEETSLVNESAIIGREGDKGALLRLLLGSESCSQNVSIVSIVGVGGIGKSTLAQLLYNDKEVKNHFEAMSWVCVSDEFDVFKISMAIFKDVGGDDRKFETLNQLQVALTEKLSKKRFLLVLDDVWNENHQKWDLLQRPFRDGSPGSKVLVTTRNTTVASVMKSFQSYNLNILLDEDALSLFAQHALGKQNFDSHPTLKLHGEGIVKKCGGLPLALITLGRVLRTKSNVEDWEVLLNSELWNLPYENDLFPALRLSYYDLPSHLKQMFAYCSLFPKDYIFDTDWLVLLWMGEGFLCESNGKSMERFGRECFEELVSRSFFMLSTDDESRYTMHDLINDLARSVAGEFFFMLDDNMDFDGKHEGLGKFHHLSFIREKYEADKMFKALQSPRHLRTFLPMSVSWLYSWKTNHISNRVLVELLPQLQFLRVLSLANYNITCVPESVGRLKHMRYLNLSNNTGITCLPEQVGELHNLQSLLLSNCRNLSTLPNSTTKLINLRHLYLSNTRITYLPEQVGDLRNLQSLLLSGCRNLSTLPKSTTKLINLRHLDISNTRALDKTSLGTGGWTGLQNLSKIVIGENDEFNISDLKGLWQLQGELSITGLHKVINVVQAKEVQLQQKKGICDLKMEWINNFDDSRNKASEYEVLEVMRPFQKLSSLKVLYYGGTKFPSWVGDPRFDCLTRLTLHGCRSCTCLPTLGQLSSLQKLFVESMDRLKSLGSEFLGSSIGVAFPLLEVLEFKDMKNWEKWSIDIAGAFPCLREISLINCGKLDVVAIELIPSLQVLHVEGCSLLVLKSMVGVSSSIVRLTMKNIKGLTHVCGEVLEHLTKVEYVFILECDELAYLWESEAATLEILLRLQTLDVRDCKNLVTLGEKDMQSVKDVKIQSCKKLKSYNCPSSIEDLKIWQCHSLTSLSFPTMDGHPSTLKVLSISSCNNVKVSWLVNNFLSSLKLLHFFNLPSLRWLPEGCLVHLTGLVIYSCDNIESIPDNGYGFLPSHCLRHLQISNCKNLKSLPYVCFQSLASLSEMVIYNCPNLNYSFPCGLWPPNLSSLKIGDLKKPISKWGMQNFPNSIVTLILIGGVDSGVVSFAKAKEDKSSFLLPSSLIFLTLIDFMELESLSMGLQHLTCLQELSICSCPKLRDLPKTLLPSLSTLSLKFGCSEKLITKCSRKGKYWPIISQIPHLDIK